MDVIKTGEIRNLNQFSINHYKSSLESVLKWILPYLENVEKLKVFPFVNHVDPSLFSISEFTENTDI